MKYYEMIENTNDTFVIKTIHGLEKFSEIVVNSKVKKELEDNNIDGISFTRMHSKNHSTGEIYNDLFLIKIMNVVLNFKSKFSSIPEKFDICIDSENHIFISDKVRDIFIRGGLTRFSYNEKIMKLYNLKISF